jgi:hypothetical protein
MLRLAAQARIVFRENVILYPVLSVQLRLETYFRWVTKVLQLKCNSIKLEKISSCLRHCGELFTYPSNINN